MSLYAKSYEKALKRYDPDLFVARNVNGVLCVFKHSKRYELVMDDANFRLYDLRRSIDYVFAITSNWGMSGKEQDYGIDDVVDHIQKIDSLANAKFLEEIDAKNEQVDKAKSKRLKNEMEGMLAYEKRRFAKIFDEIAPISGGMSMDEPKKRYLDRSIKNGNCK